MKAIKLMMPLLLAALLSACCPGKPDTPSEAAARMAVEQQIQAFSQGCIKLVQFHKHDGQDRILGDTMLVKATAELEFLQDCNWPINTQLLALKTIGREIPNVRKGEHRTADLTLQFHRTDSGWKASL